MEKSKTQKRIFRFIILWLIAGVLEYPFMRFFLASESNLPYIPLYLTIIAHLLSSLLLYFSITRSIDKNFNLRAWGEILSTLNFFLPVIGWMISTWLFFLFLKYPDNEMPLPEPDEVQNDTHSKTLLHSFLFSAKKGMDEKVREGSDITPLVDILNGDDVDLKRSAIEQLAKYKTPEAISILLLHRSGSSLEVRFYVTSALTQIKKQFDEELEAAKLQMRKDIYKHSARVFLAKTYYNYANSNLLDDTTSSIYKNEALEHLDFCIKAGHANEEVYWLKIKILTEQNEYEKALKTLETFDTQSDENRQKITQYKITLLFQLKKYVEMLHELKELNYALPENKDWRGLALWWGISL